MQFIKWFAKELNFPAACRRYGISLWQCPQFLFIVMGMVIIAAMLATWFIGRQYSDEPGIVALIVMAITIVLFSVGHSLIRGFERLAEVSRMKSEFVSIVSHQLRSPLSNMKWMLEFLASGRAGAISGKQAEYVGDAQENAERMIVLVRDLLHVSRIEQGMLSFENKSFPLEDLLRHILSDFEHYAHAQNVQLSFTPENQSSLVLGDLSKVKIAAENIIDNAIRYSKPNGTVEVSIRKKNPSILCAVKDEGVGIPTEEQRYIFKKFFRAQNVTRYQTEGSGLGLYIAKAFIEKMGGKIGFTSEENKGSTFWFTLPQAK